MGPPAELAALLRPVSRASVRMRGCKSAVPAATPPLALQPASGRAPVRRAGVMLYGNGVFGILEANYALAVVHLVSAACGAHVWSDKLGFFFPRVPARLAMLQVVSAVFYVAIVFMCIQMAGQIFRVYRAAVKMETAAQGNKKLGAIAATEHLLYFVTFFTLAFLFLQQRQHGGALHARALLLCATLSYTTILTQLIMAHMAKEVYRPAWAPFAVLALGAVNAIFDLVQSEALAYTLAALVLAMYLHYVTCVVQQICAFLGIQCFTIPVKQP